MNWIFLLMLALIALGCAGVEHNAASRGVDENGSLPQPIEVSGLDVIKALKGRHSTREFDSKRPIPADILATILWAADGVNRPSGKHTAPCAMGIRYMHIYMCRADGVWRYNQDAHTLVEISKEDVRSYLSRQKFMAEVPVVLILVSDLSAFNERVPNLDTAIRREWSHASAGCIAQNVYLAAEAFGLATVMAGGMNVGEVRKKLSLKEDEIPLYLMPLGYPK